MGLDINEEEIKTATQSAVNANVTNAKFQWANVNEHLPFDDETFDAFMCTKDSMNHFRDRLTYFRE